MVEDERASPVSSRAAEPGEETDEDDPRDEPGSEQAMRLSDRAELDRIIELYMAGEYQTCSTDLDRFLDDDNDDRFEDRNVIEKGRLYYASCALLDGHRTKARRALRAALEQNPLMPSPDSLTFPPPVVSLFLEVRDEVQQLIAESEKEQVTRLRRENEMARRRAEARERRERELEKLAREQIVIQKNSRFLASLPFGVGQFQNQDKARGAAFLVTEILLLGTAVTSGLILEDLTSRAAAGGGIVVGADVYNQRAGAAYKTLKWSSWAFLGVAAAGIFEAHLSYEPEIQLQTRRRELPPELEQLPPEVTESHEPPENGHDFSLAPTVDFGPTGVSFGLSGAF